MVTVLALAVSCTSASMEPAAGVLAFAFDLRTVRVIDTEGQILTEYSVFLATPHWSPECNKLLVGSDIHGAARVVDWKTGDVTQILLPALSEGHSHTYWDVSWAPDGTRLVFARDEGLYQVSVAGSSRDQLLRCDMPCKYVAWSPDGQSIAFVESGDDRGRPKSILKILDTATGSVVEMVTVSEGTDNFAPQSSIVGLTWSPDSKQLAFIGTLNQESRGGLYILEITDGEPFLAVPKPNPGWMTTTHMTRSLSWSPDGSQIAYAWLVESGSDDFYSEIRVVDVETLKSMTVWSNDGPPRIASGLDWCAEP